MTNSKTIIACRPGMQQQMQAAFGDLEVIVDDTLTKDYEFRERPLTLDELLEDEVAKAERQEADPKNALTFCVPLSVADADDINTWDCPVLAVRIEQSHSRYDIQRAIQSVKVVQQGTFPVFEVNVPATIGAIRAALKDNGYNVLSISEADGLIMLDNS